METKPPTVTRILIAVGFTISCFGLALFLWLAFGGPIPLKPEGYRFTVPLHEATQLAQESDVRISGVSVGKVKSVELSDEGYADATIELDSAYAPIPDDTRAVLRSKTLLGESYVELSPGSQEAESLPEGGSLAPAQVAESVQLDEIFRTFDPRTRAAFQDWMQGQAAAFRGRGDDFSVAIASLPSFADQTDRLLRLLDSQDVALSSFVRDGGETFGALTERSGQLRGTIENSAEVFATTAERNQELADIFRIFPTFLRESRATLTRLEQFAVDTDPVVVGLRPTARELTPTLLEVQRLAPVLDTFFTGLLEATAVGPRGLKATRNLLDSDLPPILEGFDPWLADFNAILKVFGMYKLELTSLVANVAAASNGIFFDPTLNKSSSTTCAPRHPSPPRRSRPIRTACGSRAQTPTSSPAGSLDVPTGLASFETRHCTTGLEAFLDPTSPTNPAFTSHVGGDPADAQTFFDRLQKYAFSGQTGTPDVRGAAVQPAGAVPVDRRRAPSSLSTSTSASCPEPAGPAGYARAQLCPGLQILPSSGRTTDAGGHGFSLGRGGSGRSRSAPGRSRTATARARTRRSSTARSSRRSSTRRSTSRSRCSRAFARRRPYTGAQYNPVTEYLSYPRNGKFDFSAGDGLHDAAAERQHRGAGPGRLPEGLLHRLGSRRGPGPGNIPTAPDVTVACSAARRRTASSCTPTARRSARPPRRSSARSSSRTRARSSARPSPCRMRRRPAR